MGSPTVKPRGNAYKKAGKQKKLHNIEMGVLRDLAREQEAAIKAMRRTDMEPISDSLKKMVEEEARAPKYVEHTPYREWRTAEEVKAAREAEQERVSSKVEIVVIRRAK